MRKEMGRVDWNEMAFIPFSVLRAQVASAQLVKCVHSEKKTLRNCATTVLSVDQKCNWRPRLHFCTPLSMPTKGNSFFGVFALSVLFKTQTVQCSCNEVSFSEHLKKKKLKATANNTCLLREREHRSAHSICECIRIICISSCSIQLGKTRSGRE